MRIAQVSPYLHPHVGGVESHVETVSVELARRGHEITILTSAQPGAPAEERWKGCRIVRVPALANVFTTPITPSLRRVIEEGAFDVVHSHSPPPLSSWYAARAVRRAKLPHVLTYHCDLEIPVPGGRFIVETYRRTLGRFTVSRADILVATTRTYAATSRALWSREDVRVVPNPVDVARFGPDRDGFAVRLRHGLGTRPVALFVGRLQSHKGIEQFIHAAEHTRRDVVHLVVGDGPRRPALEKLARETAAPDRILFAGRVPYDELPDYYAAATLGVLPSTSRLEAFGIAALEAMATCRPVVVSDIPGVTEVITNNETGLLADPLNARDLAEKINVLVADPDFASQMGKRARERVLEHFSITPVVDSLENAYRDAIVAQARMGGARR